MVSISRSQQGFVSSSGCPESYNLIIKHNRLRHSFSAICQPEMVISGHSVSYHSSEIELNRSLKADTSYLLSPKRWFSH